MRRFLAAAIAGTVGMVASLMVCALFSAEPYATGLLTGISTIKAIDWAWDGLAP